MPTVLTWSSPEAGSPGKGSLTRSRFTWNSPAIAISNKKKVSTVTQKFSYKLTNMYYN